MSFNILRTTGPHMLDGQKDGTAVCYGKHPRRPERVLFWTDAAGAGQVSLPPDGFEEHVPDPEAFWALVPEEAGGVWYWVPHLVDGGGPVLVADN